MYDVIRDAKLRKYRQNDRDSYVKDEFSLEHSSNNGLNAEVAPVGKRHCEIGEFIYAFCLQSFLYDAGEKVGY
ncbi:hypothetical protein A33Q_2863 [Indibacter alkaliphilus LW1]|uniref:Uncharacterized protein n=1 Tax=Indibacter alkaliphilus (strain CCUG 57479 / KCTC 22604 / LW1) TaxID=1189612 RepID=S2DTT8_INDAL|nr:hypothetical protein A33Q_2863 [Indibacter alkaliphilus LW1]